MSHYLRRPSRREFLGALGAAAALPAQTPELRIGFSLYAMQDFRIGDALEICGRIGYEAIELTVTEGWPAEPKLLTAGDRGQIRSQLAEHGMTVPALMERILLTADDGEHSANLEKIRQAADLAHDLSIDNPPVLETVLGGRPERWDELSEGMVERVRDWGRVAEEVDLTIALKAHVGGAAHLPEHVLELARRARSGRVQVAYDYSHFQLRGLDMAGTLREMLPHTVFVHVKDAAGTPEKPQFLVPGDGDTDYVELFRRLAAGGYRGAVVVEISSQIQRRPDYDPIRLAENALEFLLDAREQSSQAA